MAELRSWAVIGGGIMGMTLALRLRQTGHQVTIYESDSKSGGLTGSRKMGNVTWDSFYHVILLSDLNTRRILKEIGLEEEIKWVETKTGFYSDSKLFSMSNLVEYLKFPPLNLIDKFRLGATILYASRVSDWKSLEKIYVSDWLRKLSGDRVFDKIWLPLLKAKLGENYRQTSASFIWTTIQRMYAARKSGLKKEMFGYIPGGFERINSRLSEHLQRIGVEIRYGARAIQVCKGDSGTLKVTDTKGNIDVYDHVISTLSAPLSTALSEDLSAAEKEMHKAITYLGVICPSILIKKPISSYYVTNIIDTWTPFTGIIEMTALIDRAETAGYSLVYLPKYVNPEDPMFEHSDEQLRETFLKALFKMYPHISEEDIAYWGVSKARYVFALPTIDYSVKLPPVKTSMENFYIVNSAQIINGTLNVNETIQVAEQKLKEIL